MTIVAQGNGFAHNAATCVFPKNGGRAWTMRIAFVVMICLMNIPALAVDWREVEVRYETRRAELEAQGPPEYYVIPFDAGLALFDSRPELGIGMHQVDQEGIDILKETHVRFVRFTLYWNLIETTEEPGVYDETALQSMDETVKLFEANNIIPVVVVHGNPPGVSFSTRHESYERFARFMAFAAERWPYVRYWELWNEMDVAFTDLFGAGVEPEVPMIERGRNYAQMLRLAYPAIREANPKAIVVTGGMDNYTEFPRGIYEAGGRPYFDIMNMHTYGIPSQWSFVQRGAAMRDLMAEFGDGRKPLWNTEFGVDAGSMVQAWGIPDADPPAFWDAKQKEMLSECIQFALASGLYQKFFAYQFHAGNEIENERIAEADVVFPKEHTVHDYGFGFMREDQRTPRPIWEWIVAEGVNDPERLGSPRTLGLSVTAGDTERAMEVFVHSDFPTLVGIQSHR